MLKQAFVFVLAQTGLWAMFGFRFPSAKVLFILFILGFGLPSS